MKRNLFIIVLSLSVVMLNGCSGTSDMQHNSNAKENTNSESAPEGFAVPAEPETDIREKADQTESEETSFYGTWEVRDYQTADIYALSQEEINDFLDDTVTYQSDEVIWNDKKISIAEYKYETYTEELLVQNYRANLGEWWNGIGDISYVFVTSQESFFGDQFFAVDDDTIWIFYEGVFFLAKKI